MNSALAILALCLLHTAKGAFFRHGRIYQDGKSLQPRYLTFKSHGGFGNRLQAFQVSLVLARHTGRILVAPSFSDAHMGGRHVPYTTYFRAIDGVVLGSDVDLSRLQKETLDVKPDNCGIRMEDVVKRYRDSTVDILEYTGGWGYWEAMFSRVDHAAFFQSLQRDLRYTVGIEAGAALLQSWLMKPYGGVHFRLGDKQAMALFNCSTLGLSWRPGRFGCEGGAIERSIAELPLAAPGLAHVYIATNRPDDERVKATVARLRRSGQLTWTFDDFPEAVRRSALSMAYGPDVDPQSGDRDGTMISILEQQIITTSSFYVPSFPSSWDAHVIDTRVLEQREHSTVNFDLMVAEVQRVVCSRLRPMPRTP